jgi:hypothetical protein
MITKGEYNYFKRIEQKFPCGCHIDEMIDNSYVITYCPLHQAAPEMLKALKGILLVATPINENSTMVFEKEYFGGFEVLGNILESACDAIAKAEGR